MPAETDTGEFLVAVLDVGGREQFADWICKSFAGGARAVARS